MLVIIFHVSFLFPFSFCLSFHSILLIQYLKFSSPPQFFLIIVGMFAAEVAALVLSFIYQGKVSYR